jgi:hypothetical protein
MFGLLAFSMIADYKAPYQEFFQTLSEVLVATKPLEIWPGTSGFELIVADPETGLLYAQAQRIAFRGVFDPSTPGSGLRFEGSLDWDDGSPQLERVEPKVTEWLSLIVRREGESVHLSWSAAASDGAAPVLAEGVMKQVIAELEHRF